MSVRKTINWVTGDTYIELIVVPPMLTHEVFECFNNCFHDVFDFDFFTLDSTSPTSRFYHLDVYIINTTCLHFIHMLYTIDI